MHIKKKQYTNDKALGYTLGALFEYNHLIKSFNW